MKRVAVGCALRSNRCLRSITTAPRRHGLEVRTAHPTAARRRATGRGPGLRVPGLGVALILALALLLTACGDPGTGPVEVRWDRAACERCRMVLSDRRHAAQVRERTAAGRSRVYVFDDLGCAVIWLADRPGRDDPGTEVWVSDWRTGAWIDARTAAYVPNQVTPMGYGLGAQPDPAPGTLDYAQAQARIIEVERTHNIHGGHLDPARPPPIGAP